MSYFIDTEIKELELKIPIKDFPLESDLIVGYKYPFIRYPEDEGDWDEKIQSDLSNGFYSWEIKKGQNFFVRENGDYWISELNDLVLKYNGTLIAESIGEEKECEYIRIREGVRKKVKIVEED